MYVDSWPSIALKVRKGDKSEKGMETYKYLKLRNSVDHFAEQLARSCFASYHHPAGDLLLDLPQKSPLLPLQLLATLDSEETTHIYRPHES